MANIKLPIRTPRDVGILIRTRRRKLGMDQSELAEKIGVSRLWVSQMEGGKPGAGIGLVLRAFNALGLSVTAFDPNDQDTGHEGLTPLPIIDIDAIVAAARKVPGR